MTSPFRALAVVPDYPPPVNPHSRVGKGTRGCVPPGWWRRLFGGYNDGDTWKCDCGQAWVWQNTSSSYVYPRMKWVRFK